MGGSTTTEKTQSSTTQPWAPAQPLLGGILGRLGHALDSTQPTGNEAAALSALEADARAGNPWAPQIGSLATTLLSGGPDRGAMVTDAYDSYRTALTPFARGDYLDPSSNPVLQKYLGLIGDDVANRVNGMFAAAGRDLSGANVQTLARGIAQGQAPVLADAYRLAIGDRQAATDRLFEAGTRTAGLLSDLDQSALADRRSGIGAAQAATQAQLEPLHRMLAVEAARRGIPLEALSRIAAMAVPIAGLGQSTTGTTAETTNVPLADRLAGFGATALGLLGKVK